MTSVAMSVYFDFVCPFCLLAEDLITEVAGGADLTVVWKAFELRPYPERTLRPEDDYLPAIWQRSVYPMARRLKIPIVLPSVSPQPYSRIAFEGMIYAQRHGRQHEYNARVFKAFFQENQNIGDLDALCALATDVGLDSAEFRQAILEGRHAEEHQAALRDARAAEINSVPTIIVGDHRLTGVPDRAQLVDLISRAADSAASSP